MRRSYRTVSTNIEDDHAAVWVVVVLFSAWAARRQPWDRQLQPRLVLFATLTFPLLALPYLLDDEGRQHR
jgi:hypothetical protein